MATFPTIVVGMDGGEGGRDAAALAHALEPDHLLLVAAEPSPAPFLVGAAPHAPAVGEDVRRALLGTAAEIGGDDAELLQIDDSSPARALQHLAVERGADLLVVGSAHHGPAGRVTAGDVSRGVLHHAFCPVAVVPRGFADAPRRPRTIGVGYNGTPESERALELAAQIAIEHHGRLAITIAYAAPTWLVGYVDRPQILVDDLERHASELLRETLARLSGEPTGHVAEGPAKQVLTAASEDVDLMVVGSRGWGALRRVALGSTSDHLIHHASAPVIVVPRPITDSTVDPEGSPCTTS